MRDKRTWDDPENWETCFIHGGTFRYGTHQYDGRPCPGYGFMVCNNCWANNEAGWPSYREQKIFAWLEEHDIDEPEREENGLLPREF